MLRAKMRKEIMIGKRAGTLDILNGKSRGQGKKTYSQTA
jgi:hypothetical protein